MTKVVSVTAEEEEEVNLGTLTKLVLSLKHDVAANQKTTEAKIAEVVKSQEFIAEAYDEITKKLDAVIGLQKRVEDLEEVVAMRDNENFELRKQIRDLEQYSRRSQLEFLGLPQKPDEKPEDLEAAVLTIANQLEVNLKGDDLEAVHRIPTLIKPSPIIVSFVNRKNRDLLLKNRYKHPTKYDGADKVFIRESLSKYFRELLKLTKEKADACNYDYCWFKNKQIYVKRKKESREVIIVKEMNDLNKLIKVDRESRRNLWKTPHSPSK